MYLVGELHVKSPTITSVDARREVHDPDSILPPRDSQVMLSDHLLPMLYITSCWDHWVCTLTGLMNRGIREKKLINYQRC